MCENFSEGEIFYFLPRVLHYVRCNIFAFKKFFSIFIQKKSNRQNCVFIVATTYAVYRSFMSKVEKNKNKGLTGLSKASNGRFYSLLALTPLPINVLQLYSISFCKETSFLRGWKLFWDEFSLFRFVYGFVILFSSFYLKFVQYSLQWDHR